MNHARHRPTSRVVLLNPQSQILLFEIADTNTDVTHFWVTPGGGLEPGESWEQAARRELFEETGFVASNLEGPIWYRRKLVCFKGEWIDVEEFYFLARVEDFVLTHNHNPSEYELSTQKASRWWSLAELQSATVTVFPEGLASHLGPILLREFPLEPIDIGALAEELKTN